MSVRMLVILSLSTSALSAGCSSAPAFRAQALVRVPGRGEAAWRNAREAASALTLRLNLSRLERDVRRRRLRMLDVEDPVRALQDVVVAKRTGKGKVRVRIYGDDRFELRTLCRALLALWETEGLMGRTPKTEPPRVEEEASSAPPSSQDRVKVARQKAELEEEQRKLYAEKQRLLSEQVDLGQKWQDAERNVQALTKESTEARKALAAAESEQEKLKAVMDKPIEERLSALGDADVMRLAQEVRESEAALKKADSLPKEIRARVEHVLARKKKALAMAQGRFEKEAETKVTDAKERVTSIEKRLDAATRGQSDVRGKRYALENRLGQIENELKTVDGRFRQIEADAASAVRRPPPPARNRRVILDEAKVYRMAEVVRPCRIYRLHD